MRTLVHVSLAAVVLVTCGSCGSNSKEEAPTSTGKIEIVGSYQCTGSKDTGLDAARDALQSHPDIVGIFAINDPSALGARAAVEAESKQDEIVIVGFDGQPEAKVAIKDGKLFDSPVQFPDKMAVEVVKGVVKYFKGEKLDPEMLIKTVQYRLEDAEKDAALGKDVQVPPPVEIKEVKGTIGLSVQTLTNPFFKLIADTVSYEASKQGYKVLVRDAQEKIENQKDQEEGNFLLQNL